MCSGGCLAYSHWNESQIAGLWTDDVGSVFWRQYDIHGSLENGGRETIGESVGGEGAGKQIEV